MREEKLILMQNYTENFKVSLQQSQGIKQEKKDVILLNKWNPIKLNNPVFSIV